VLLNEAADAVLAQRGSKDEGLVFSSSNWDRYRTAWENTVKRAKLIDLHWHDLRHTFASWAVQRRVSLYELKEVLGHSTLRWFAGTPISPLSTCAPPPLPSTESWRRRPASPSATARRQQASRSKSSDVV
jgi:hypothetical protein